MLAIASSFFFPGRMRNGGKINSGDLRGRQTFVLEVILIVSDFHKELLREKKKHNRIMFWCDAFLTTF